jgi:hypothetical protein
MLVPRLLNICEVEYDTAWEAYVEYEYTRIYLASGLGFYGL